MCKIPKSPKSVVCLAVPCGWELGVGVSPMTWESSIYNPQELLGSFKRRAKHGIYMSCFILLGLIFYIFVFPTCQVRVVRFYVSCLLLPRPPPPPVVVLLVLLLNCDSRSTVFSVGPQPRPSTPSVPCRTSTTTIHAQCSLPDLNHDHPRPVFPAGPQPRPSTPSVPCRTSTASIHAKCSLPDLM